jgi:hypothetical protein
MVLQTINRVDGPLEESALRGLAAHAHFLGLQRTEQLVLRLAGQPSQVGSDLLEATCNRINMVMTAAERRFPGAAEAGAREGMIRAFLGPLTHGNILKNVDRSVWGVLHELETLERFFMALESGQARIILAPGRSGLWADLTLILEKEFLNVPIGKWLTECKAIYPRGAVKISRAMVDVGAQLEKRINKTLADKARTGLDFLYVFRGEREALIDIEKQLIDTVEKKMGTGGAFSVNVISEVGNRFDHAGAFMPKDPDPNHLRLILQYMGLPKHDVRVSPRAQKLFKATT